MATALTDYPALNVHVHAGPLRALVGLLGIRGTGTGMIVEPGVPDETFQVIFPRLTLASFSTELEVEVKGDTIIPSTRVGDFVEFTLPGHADVAVARVVRAQ